MSIRTVYEIDGTAAVSAIHNIQSAFQGYNGALGQVISQSAQYNSVGGRSRQVLTQVSTEGLKTVSVLKEVAGGYELISVKTSAASNAQRKLATTLREQSDLAGRLADSVRAGAGPGRPVPSTTVPSVSPTKIGLPVGAYSNLTEAQLRAAAAARGLSAAETTTLLGINRNAATAKQGFDTLSSATDAFKNKLEQVGKIAFATLIYRGISLIQQGLAEGTKTALDYSHQIGLIQTISQDSGESFDTWNASIRAVADELGRPVAEVAKDTYDALSNQVIRTTKDFDLLRTSIILEQNTGSAPGTGLNTLSALINGLGVSSIQAESLADKLFVTIDKGRVRLEELDKVLGRTISLQQQAGAGFDETNGALAVLTQSGIDSAEATTLLNNVYSEIIKPNEALSAQFRKLGFDSGASAVKALTLVGVLKKLGDIAKSTPAGLATFFPDIRGLRGVSSLFTQSESFQKAVEANQKAGGENKAAKGILDENEAQRVLKETARIKNYFTVDLGVGIIQTLAKISDALGGFSRALAAITPIAIGVGGAITSFLALQAITTFAKAIGQLSIGFRAVASAIGLANASALIFGKTLGSVQLSLGLIAAGGTLVFLALSAASTAASELTKNAAEIRLKPINTDLDKQLSDSKELASKRVEDFNQATDKITSGYELLLSKARKLNDGLAESSKTSLDTASESLRNSFDIALTYIRKNVGEIEAAEEKSLTNLKKLSEGIADDRREASDRQRDYQIDAIKESYEKQKSYAEHYNQQVAAAGGNNFIAPKSQPAIDAFGKIAQAQINQARVARDAFLKKGDLKEAEKEYDKINEALTKYKANVEAVGGKTNSVPVADAFYATEQENKKLAAKKLIEAQNAKEYNQALQQRQLVEKLNDLYKDQGKFQSEVFNKKGGLEDKYATDPTKALEDFDALQKKRHDLQAQLSAPKSPIEALRLTGALAQADQEAAAQRAALESRLASATTDKELTSSSQARLALVEAEKKAYEGLAQTILDNNKKIAVGAADLNKVAGETLAQLRTPLQGVLNPKESFIPFSGAFPDKLLGPNENSKVQQTLQDIQNLSKAANLDIPQIKAKINELQESTASVSEHRIVDPRDTTATITIKEALQRMSDSLAPLKEAKSDIGDAAIQMLQLKSAINSIDTKALGSIVGTIEQLNTTAGGLSADATGIDTLTGAMNRAADAARNEAAALVELNKARGGATGGTASPAGTGGSVEPRAGGGVVGSGGGFLSDFYSGKFAKGTDTIPAMLTRDEFVIRAPMARKFFSQLVAINNNQAPIYRSEGGSTGNSTSHSYNINVGGGNGSPKETAKVVVQAVRRAQRQGTIR